MFRNSLIYSRFLVLLAMALFSACGRDVAESPTTESEFIRKGTVEAIDAVSRAYSAQELPLLVFTYPWIAQIHPQHSSALAYEDRAGGWAEASSKLEKYEGQLPIVNLTDPLLNAFSEFDPSILYEDSLHWGDEGNEILADLIFEELKGRGFKGAPSSICLLGDSFARRLAPFLEARGLAVELFWQNGAADRVAGDFFRTIDSGDYYDAAIWLLADHYYAPRGYFAWNDDREFPAFRMGGDSEGETPPQKVSIELQEVSSLPDRNSSPYPDCLITATALRRDTGKSITLVYLGMEGRKYNPQIAFFRPGVSFDGLIEPFSQITTADSKVSSLFRIDSVSEVDDEVYWLHSYSNLVSPKS